MIRRLEGTEVYPGTVRIPFSRAKMAVSALGALAFAAGIWFMVGELHARQNGAGDPMNAIAYETIMPTLVLCGLGSTGLGLIGVVHLIQRWAFVLGPEGLLDNSLIRPTLNRLARNRRRGTGDRGVPHTIFAA